MVEPSLTLQIESHHFFTIFTPKYHFSKIVGWPIFIKPTVIFQLCLKLIIDMKNVQKSIFFLWKRHKTALGPCPCPYLPQNITFYQKNRVTHLFKVCSQDSFSMISYRRPIGWENGAFCLHLFDPSMVLIVYSVSALISRKSLCLCPIPGLSDLVPFQT